MTIQFEPICKVFGLFSCSNQLNNGKKLLVTVKFFLFLQDKHEVMSKTTLHHDPVYSTGQIDISGQKDNVLALQRCDGLVNLHEM